MRTKEQRLHDRTLAADRRFERSFKSLQAAQHRYHHHKKRSAQAHDDYLAECARVDVESDLPRVTVVDPEDKSKTTAFVVERAAGVMIVRDPGVRLNHQYRVFVQHGSRFVDAPGYYIDGETP